MKKFSVNAALSGLLIMFLFLQTSCVKDVCKNSYTYTYFQPLYKTTAEVRANIKSNAPRAIVNPGKIY
ncbi:MAG: hypothetical protein ACOYLO_15100, partial [Ferruginibacter sp.]